MKGEQAAMQIFELVKKDKMLPSKIEDLVPLSFIGQAAVTFYRQKVKLMDQLNMTEDQRLATLADGQDAGEMLLTIEDRIGELALKEPRAQSIAEHDHKGDFRDNKPSGKPPKHERLGMDAKRMEQAQQIHNNPEAVKRVLREAKENQDIPTKTAVLSTIKTEKVLKTLKKVKEERVRERILNKKKPTIDKYLGEVEQSMDDSRSKLAALEGKIKYIESKLNKETFIISLNALYNTIGRIRKEFENG